MEMPSSEATMTRLRGSRSVSAPKIGAESDAEGGRGDGHAGGGFGGAKELREQRQQRLGAVELEECANAA
jgi:hypothetical protein